MLFTYGELIPENEHEKKIDAFQYRDNRFSIEGYQNLIPETIGTKKDFMVSYSELLGKRKWHTGKRNCSIGKRAEPTGKQ